MPIKPIHVALGLGAVLLLRKKPVKPTSTVDVARASASATASTARLALGAKQVSTVEARQLRALRRYLVKTTVGAPPFGANNLPSLYEMMVLRVIAPDVFDRLPNEIRSEFWYIVQRNSITGNVANLGRSYTPAQKITIGIGLLTTEQCRNFSADCLEIALPAFIQRFPDNPAGSDVIQALRAYARQEMSAYNLRWYADQVTASYRGMIEGQPFAEAVSMATYTEEFRQRHSTMLTENIDRAFKGMVSLVQKSAVRAQGQYAWEKSLATHDISTALAEAEGELLTDDPYRQNIAPKPSAIDNAESARKAAMKNAESEIYEKLKKIL